MEMEELAEYFDERTERGRDQTSGIPPLVWGARGHEGRRQASCHADEKDKDRCPASNGVRQTSRLPTERNRLKSGGVAGKVAGHGADDSRSLRMRARDAHS